MTSLPPRFKQSTIDGECIQSINFSVNLFGDIRKLDDLTFSVSKLLYCSFDILTSCSPKNDPDDFPLNVGDIVETYDGKVKKNGKVIEGTDAPGKAVPQLFKDDKNNEFSFFRMIDYSAFKKCDDCCKVPMGIVGGNTYQEIKQETITLGNEFDSGKFITKGNFGDSIIKNVSNDFNPVFGAALEKYLKLFDNSINSQGFLVDSNSIAQQVKVDQHSRDLYSLMEQMSKNVVNSTILNCDMAPQACIGCTENDYDLTSFMANTSRASSAMSAMNQKFANKLQTLSVVDSQSILSPKNIIKRNRLAGLYG